MVDPGGEPSRIRRKAKAFDLTIASIVETHGHYDHTGGSAELQGMTGAPIYRHASRLKKNQSQIVQR